MKDRASEPSSSSVQRSFKRSSQKASTGIGSSHFFPAQNRRTLYGRHSNANNFGTNLDIKASLQCSDTAPNDGAKKGEKLPSSFHDPQNEEDYN